MIEGRGFDSARGFCRAEDRDGVPHQHQTGARESGSEVPEVGREALGWPRQRGCWEGSGGGQKSRQLLTGGGMAHFLPFFKNIEKAF